MCKKGYCIICHQDNQELSDEHVIPEAIGGYYHIYNVCKDCNSKLGDHVDRLLLNHWFIKAARHEKGLKGYKGYIPNPLVGEGCLSTGEKVRVEQDNDGELSIRFIPTSPEFLNPNRSLEKYAFFLSYFCYFYSKNQALNNITSYRNKHSLTIC